MKRVPPICGSRKALAKRRGGGGPGADFRVPTKPFTDFSPKDHLSLMTKAVVEASPTKVGLHIAKFCLRLL
jgi:hypothetical protein